VVRRVNLERTELSYDEDDPPGYAAAAVRLGGQLGSEELSINLFEVPPGQSLCPYHYEYVEEWLLVLDGAAAVRVPGGEEQLERGDLVLFPSGPEGAHKVTNRGEEPVRFLMFSSSREPAVAVYPDSDKVGVWSGNQDDHWMFHRAGAKVSYYEGEI
jgi:uncharacterized cupin superfamily protein